MIQITELAADILHDSLVAGGVDSAKTLRLKRNGSQFMLDLDVPGTSDRIVEHNGVAILLIDLRLERKIGDALIDVKADADDLQLVIHMAKRIRADERSIAFKESAGVHWAMARKDAVRRFAGG